MPRFLMCAPEHFGVLYVINPWMDGQVGATTAIDSSAQWESLYSAVREVAEVDLLPSTVGLPDLVFTANAALVYGNTAVISRFLYPERQGEEQHAEAWFRAQGFDVRLLPPGVYFEGAGDALFDRAQPLLWFAHGIRSSADALQYLADWIDVEMQPLTLLRSSFYHLDTCFCPLEGGALLYYPAAFDAESVRAIEARVPAEMRLAVSEDDALAFACNAVSVAGRVILNRASKALRSWLEARGFLVVETPTSEFMKAGGSTKCMTLRLDEAPVAARLESGPGALAAIPAQEQRTGLHGSE